MEETPISPALKVAAGLMFLFLLAPLLVVVPISFSGDNFMTFPPSSLSFKWYAAIFSDASMTRAFTMSLLLALVVTAISLVVGLAGAYALVRLRPPGADALASLFAAPLLLPAIVLGLAMLLVLARWVCSHLPGSGRRPSRDHAALCGARPVHGPVQPAAAVEEAASTLGASPLIVFRRVTLPMMRSGLVSASALCFLVSFDEVVLSLFMTGPRLQTLPVAMYNHVDQQADPLAAAISVLLVVMTLVVVVIVDRSIGLTKTFVK